MKAVVLKDFGGIENLVEEDIPIPTITENEVLVKTQAFSINPVDVKTRRGEALAETLKSEKPIILGWDISGRVAEVGENVDSFKINDEVFGMVNFVGHGKAYAEYVAVPAEHLALKPKNISHTKAAASTLAALTAWQAFNFFGKLKQNDKVLIHGAAGGVGHFAVQIAKNLGAYVIGTSSKKHKDYLFQIGVNEHIDYRNKKFEESLSDIDFVLETIGYGNFKKSVRVLREKGTIINLPSGLTKEDEKEAKKRKLNACFFMSVFSSGKDMRIIAKFLQQKIIKPYIHETYGFHQVREAHLQVESGTTKGKVIIEM